MKRSFGLIAPYATWMVLMAALPATVGGYAVRTVIVSGMLWWALRGNLRELLLGAPSRNTAASPRTPLAPASQLADARGIPDFRSLASSLLPGLITGILVFALWILPEQFDWVWYRKWCMVGEGGTQAVAEAGAAMIAVRLVGSAFVISVAEELFFRKWLIGFAGFWWMVALFAIEHDRWLVGAIAGIAYGLLYLRKGLPAAIVAHVTTNLVLGLLVIRSGQWQFW